MAQASDNLPRRCGRYVLLERLGGGGMAEVYKARLARSEGPDRVLVLKLLPPDADPTAAARFIDEATIALPLTHGNITATFEFGRDVDRPFLIMEYVHGRSLRQILEALSAKGEVMQLSTGLFLGREVARALSYAHRFTGVDGTLTPIVHRDVSPENVLVSYAGQVKLTDFGIARSSAALDIAGAWGKPAYVAPEILQGDPGSPASDLYSLACVIYEALSGWPPLVGSTGAETLRMVRERVPAPLGSLRDDVPPELSELLAQVLEKDPAARLGDAARLEVTLGRLLVEEAPHFTEAELALTLGRLFDGVQRTDASQDEALLASRLRDQLTDAGVETTGRESAAEILALGTVQLSPAPPALDEGAIHYASSPPAAVNTTLKIVPGERRAAQAAPPRTLGRWLVLAAIAIAVALGAGVATRWIPLDGTPREQRDAAVRPGPDAGAGVMTKVDAAVVPDAAARPDAASADAAAPRADAEAPAPPARPAVVTFNTQPWSFVYVNNRKLSGHTPIRDVKLAPGRYIVRFVNPELSLSYTTSVRLAPGEHRFIKAPLVRGGGAGETPP
jgi:serine/threonine protein kinase